MTRTLAQINKAIAALQREAESVRSKEVAGVVARIQEAIAFYGLKPADLFGETGRGVRAAAAAKKPARARKPAGPAKYRDPATGRTWTGHGKRPRWYVEALAAVLHPDAGLPARSGVVLGA